MTRYSNDDVKEYLSKVEDKLEKLTEVVEEILEVESFKSINDRKVDKPSNIQVNLDDEYNTTPTNHLLHNYSKNHKMFRRDAFRTVFRSKVFWVILLILPIVISFVYYVLFGFLHKHGLLHGGSVKFMISYNLNQFIITPLLLLSLIIFPSIIANAREDNTLKRYLLFGMSKRQLYYSYMRFSILFILIYVFVFIGPWLIFINFSLDRIFLTREQLEAGVHLFINPWEIFQGFNYYDTTRYNYFNSKMYSWEYNMLIIQKAQELGDYNIFELPLIFPNDVYDFYMKYIGYPALEAVDGTLEEQVAALDEINIVFRFISSLRPDSVILSISFDRFDEEGVQEIIDRLSYPVGRPLYHLAIFYGGFIEFNIIKSVEPINTYFFIFMFSLSLLSFNSIGYSKAMKVKTSRELLTWGIMIWIFSRLIQYSTSLIYTDVFMVDQTSNMLWYLLIVVLLFAVKWMFLLSPITIAIAGMTIATGLIYEPTILSGPSWAQDYLDFFNNNNTTLAKNDIVYYFTYGIYLNIFYSIDLYYESVIEPWIRTWAYIIIAILCCTYVIANVWYKKERNFSVENTR